VMITAGIQADYAREELSRWHGIHLRTITKITSSKNLNQNFYY